jgi:hypothetical protein
MNPSDVVPPAWRRPQTWHPAVARTDWSYTLKIDTPASEISGFGKAVDLGFLPGEALR